MHIWSPIPPNRRHATRMSEVAHTVKRRRPDEGTARADGRQLTYARARRPPQSDISVVPSCVSLGRGLPLVGRLRGNEPRWMPPRLGSLPSSEAGPACAAPPPRPPGPEPVSLLPIAGLPPAWLMGGVDRK